MNGDIVLITGGSGFLGQHIVKHLQEDDDDVKEIRVVDLKAYENKLNHGERKPIISYVGDICDAELILKAFENVDVVFHCAALIDFQFPPNSKEFERVNVDGTKNIVNLCIKFNVPRLIYTSCASVTLRPYLGRAPFAVVINQTESKIRPSLTGNSLIIPGYSQAKLRAEQIVLGAHSTNLSNGTGELMTTSIRPTVMYGEEDHLFFPILATWANRFGGVMPRIFGAGGKTQITYVGNVAHAHVLAKQCLKHNPKSIAGLPVFITDDTPIEDTTRFCQRLSRHTEAFKFRQSSWYIPSMIAYFLAFLIELFISMVNKVHEYKLSFQPCALVAYAGSLLLFSRLRAELHMDYVPKYNEETSLSNSVKWYAQWYETNFKTTTKNKSS